MKFSKKQSGFTLTEIIVVVAIIGIISTIVLASLNEARQKSRDAHRKAQLREIVQAFGQRYLDTNSFAIANAGASGNGEGYFNVCGTAGQGAVCMDEELQNGRYMGGLPSDPLVGRGLTSSGGHNPYMRYCAGGTANQCNGANVRLMCMTAELEGPSPQDVATLDESGLDSTLINTLKTTHGQNYAVCLGEAP